MKNIILFFLFTTLTLSILAQDSKGYTGGFQFKAMIASDYFSGDELQSNLDSVQITTSNEFGYVFGMTIRKRFGKRLGVESGLRFVQRNYTTMVDSTFGNYKGELNYRIIGYEIPLKGMVLLRASDNSLFSVSLGVQMDLYPSDVYTGDFVWQVEVRRRNWIQGSLLANVGWEYISDVQGTFYAGFSFNQPFKEPFAAVIGEYNTAIGYSNVKLNGIYLALDFRYYFPTKKKTQKQ